MYGYHINSWSEILQQVIYKVENVDIKPHTRYYQYFKAE